MTEGNTSTPRALATSSLDPGTLALSVANASSVWASVLRRWAALSGSMVAHAEPIRATTASEMNRRFLMVELRAMGPPTLTQRLIRRTPRWACLDLAVGHSRGYACVERRCVAVLAGAGVNRKSDRPSAQDVSG